MTLLVLSSLTTMVIVGLVKLTLGGGAAAVTGRAVATSWQPYWYVPLYVLLLAGVTRFLSYAMYHQPLLDIWAYLIEASILLVLASLGFWGARRHQMETQYYWRSGRERD